MIKYFLLIFMVFAGGASAEGIGPDTADQFGWPITKWLYDYQPLRKALHERIVARHLGAGVREERPKLVFTAGGYGAGKSYVTGVLEKTGILDVSNYLWIDPDALKEEIPEYAEYLARDPATAASLVHRESGHVQLLLVERALELGKNVIIDGSLRAKDWWDEEFARIRREYPRYSISILYVTASDEKILARVRDRALVTRRHIPERVVREAAAEVRASVAHLAGLADLTVEIENGTSPTIKSVQRRGETVAAHLDLAARPRPEEGFVVVEDPREYERVVVLTGYGRIGYEDYSLLRASVRTLAGRYPPRTLFVVGTPFGIGRARRWVPHATELTEDRIKALFTDPEFAGKTEVVGLRGGPATVRVIEAARRAGVPVTLVQDDALEPETEGVAVRLVRDPNFEPNATRRFEIDPRGVKIVTRLDLPEEHRRFETRTRKLRALYRGVERTADQELVRAALDNYPELILLTEGALANPEAPTEVGPPPRSAPPAAELEPLAAQGASFPRPVADVPVDFDESFSAAYYGKRYPELDRTVSMLLFFKRLLADDYEGFVRGQPESTRLTRASFGEISALVRRVAYDPHARDTLFSFLVFNNVGKARAVVEYLRDAGVARDFNHQRIMARVLETYGFLAPTFGRLDELQHRLLASAFEREFALGQFVQGELPPRYLAEWSRRSAAEKDFYLATYLIKAAAGRGHVVHLGSLVMTEPMYQGVRSAVRALETTDGSEASVVAAERDFLAERREALLPPGTPNWVVRVALMLRVLDRTEGEALARAVAALREQDRLGLARAMTATGFAGDPAPLLYYATATFDNLRKVVPASRLMPVALELLKDIVAAVPPGPADEVLQVRLDEVAARLRDDRSLPAPYAIEVFEDPNYGPAVRLVDCEASLARR